MMIFRLPIPPSANALFYNRRKVAGKRLKGRGITEAYASWLKQADAWYYLQKLHKRERITGKCELSIRLPMTRMDASNSIKAIEDWCVSRELTSDDKNNTRITVEVDTGLLTKEAWITLKGVETL